MADNANSKDSDVQRKGFERIRRVFQVNDIGSRVYTRIFTLTRDPWVDPATGVRSNGAIRDLELTSAFQYVLEANAEQYDVQLAAMRTVVAMYGNITEIGADKENVMPSHLREQALRATEATERILAKARDSAVIQLEASKIQLAEQNAELQRQNAALEARLKALEAKR